MTDESESRQGLRAVAAPPSNGLDKLVLSRRGVFGSALALGVAACSKSTGSPTSTTTTLTIQSQQGGSLLMSQQLAKDFETANPGVKVTIRALAENQKSGQNTSVLTSSGAPEVGVVPTNSPVYTTLVADKKLAVLDDVWKSSNLDVLYGKATGAALKVDGSAYVVLPDKTFYNVVYYNKDLFAKANLTEPANHRIPNLDTLYAMTAALRKAGVAPLAVGGSTDYMLGWIVDALLPTKASSDQMQNYLSSWQPSATVTAHYTDAAFLEAITTIGDWNKRGVFQDGVLGQDYNTAEASFAAGQAGMMLGGSYSVSELVTTLKTKVQFDWLLLPPLPGGVPTQITSYQGDTVAIPTASKNQDLAKKFLALMVSADSQASAVAGNGMLPAISGVPQSALAKLDTRVQQQLADSDKNGAQAGWTGAVPGTVGQQVVVPGLQKMLNGQLSAQQVCDTVDEALDKYRTAGS